MSEQKPDFTAIFSAKRRPATASAAPAAPAEPPRQAEGNADHGEKLPPPPAPIRAVPAQTVQESPTPPAEVHNVPAYVPREMRTRLKQASAKLSAKRGEAVTYTDLLVEAFDTIPEDRLQGLFSPDEPASGAMPRPRKKLQVVGGVQIQLRLNGAQESWLDAKEAELGAGSRSVLVTQVLEEFFARTKLA